MKKITQLAFVVFLLVSASGNINAQENARLVGQGKIVFDISYPNNKLDEQSLALLPSESVVYFKGNMSRVETRMGIGTTVIITDHKLGESTTLMDVLGNKTAVNMSKGEAQAQRTSNNKPVVQLTNDTKTILGYDCKKAVVTFKGESGDLTSDVWYTNELMARNSFVNEIDGIDGFMLEFTTEQNGMAIKMVAKTIQEVPVEDTQFVTPEGYTQMTQEQVKQLYTGGK